MELFAQDNFHYCTSLLYCFLHLLHQSEIIKVSRQPWVTLRVLKKKIMWECKSMLLFLIHPPLCSQMKEIKAVWEFSKWMKNDWVFLMGAGIMAWVEGAKSCKIVLQLCKALLSIWKVVIIFTGTVDIYSERDTLAIVFIARADFKLLNATSNSDCQHLFKLFFVWSINAPSWTPLLTHESI